MGIRGVEGVEEKRVKPDGKIEREQRNGQKVQNMG